MKTLEKIQIVFILLYSTVFVNAQTVNVSIDVNADRKEISPLIYGMNNALSDNQSSPLSSSEWNKLRDAGVKMVREFGGNNGTKYNWRLKLTSHPDWYNNVYSHNWNYAAQSLQTNLPGVQGMWCFQLIGKAASNKNNNFNDWAYNSSQWWEGVSNNWAGGGGPVQYGGNGGDGNPNLYLMNWTADSTVGILNYWFGNLNLDSDYFKYWSMDNEPEIWCGTHDDVMPQQLAAEEFMQKYFEVAKKARAAFPGIKIMGPVPCNEWQWYNWNDATVLYKGTYYCWLEFFIKRVAEEQASSGIKLLDVLDIHFYPGTSTVSDILQLHRVFYDDTYVYPGANGVKNVNGSWDNSQTKEYIFKRCNDWLKEYMGDNHGVTMSLSEMDINTSNVNVIANWYASMLGTFARNNVEIFTPWSWKTGMWEVIHLFSNYSKQIAVKSTSGNEQYLSAYASANAANDSVTIILVNRSQSSTYQVNTQISNFNLPNGSYKTLTLSNLPASETFISKTNNALVTSQTTVSIGTFTLSLAPLSIKAIVLAGSPLGINDPSGENKEKLLSIRYSREGRITFDYKLEKPSKLQIKVFDMSGREIMKLIDNQTEAGDYQKTLYKGTLSEGVYIITVLENGRFIVSKKFKV